MAGLSLQCGDGGALLKSVEEVQEHAELTSHTNFAESTEAVLNLLCTACGKPCRSKTETDLHTKRTGRTDFADKTAEAAKLIELEAPKAASAAAAMDVDTHAGDCVTSGQPQEMVVPDVDKSLLEQLGSMGFPPARATRSLHYSGNSSIEGAINWVAEHENDPDIDEMPMVPVSDKKESSKPALTPEEVKLKAQELRERAHKKKEEVEKRMEREKRTCF